MANDEMTTFEVQLRRLLNDDNLVDQANLNFQNLKQQNYGIRDVFGAIKRQNTEFFQTMGFQEHNIDGILAITVDSANLNRCRDVLNPSEYQAVKNMFGLDDDSSASNVTFDPVIRNKCTEAVHEIKNLEKRIEQLENQSQHQDEVAALNQRIEELFSFLCQESSIANMELSDEQRVLLKYGMIRSNEPYEGIPEAKLRLNRTDKSRYIHKQWKDDWKRMLVYSPSFSGKTSMAYLYKAYAIIVKSQLVIIIGCANYMALDSKSPFEKLLEMGASQYSFILTELLQKNRPGVEVTREMKYEKFRSIFEHPDTIVILDSAQCIYSVEAIWNYFKNVPLKQLICFSSNSPRGAFLNMISTPTNSLSLLLFSRDEVGQLANKFIQNSHNKELCGQILNEHIQQDIYTLTSGYPGLVFHAFKVLTTQYLKHQRIPNELNIELFNDIMNPDLVRCLHDFVNIINRMADIASKYNQDIKKLILTCLYQMIVQDNPPLRSDFIDSIPGDQSIVTDCVDRLVDLSIFYEIENGQSNKIISFALPLFKFYYMRMVCTQVNKPSYIL